MFRISFAFIIAVIGILSCKTYVHVADTDVRYTRIDYHESKEDREIADMIAPYKEEMESEMNEVVGYLPEDIIKSKPNSNMGNWFCDALMAETLRLHPEGADFAIQNYGGLRLPSISKGALTKGKIFELMPFDNMLVILELDGPTTKKLLDSNAEGGGSPISKEVNYKIKDGAATDIMIGGMAFDSSKSYRVAMPDYIANGGDDCDFLIPIPQDNSGVFIREVILSHLRLLAEEGKAIEIDNSKRIYNE